MFAELKLRSVGNTPLESRLYFEDHRTGKTRCWQTAGSALKYDQTTSILISVLYRSCAIPVSWRIQCGSRMDLAVELLKELAPAVPHDVTVIVLCDRGIAGPKLWTRIRARAGIQVSATGRTSPSIPRPAPLRPAGGPVCRAGGTLDHPAGLSPREAGVSRYTLRFRIKQGLKALMSLG